MKIIKKKENKRKTRLMLNIEKYKDDILNKEQSNINCCVIDLLHNGVCEYNCKDCKKNIMNWLLEEYKEPILDDVEKEYLSAVIKPFRNRVKYIVKTYGVSEARQFIRIIMHDGEYSNLPFFKGGTMYNGMKVDKQYTLQELGL